MTKAEKPDDDDEAEAQPDPPKGLAAAGWGLALFAACRALAIFLDAQATAAAVGQAVLVEWGTSRIGVGWTAPGAPTDTAHLARRGAIGAGLGLAGVVPLLVVLRVSGGVRFEEVPALSVSVLAIGLVTAGLHAWRDELLFHGVVLRAIGGSNNGSSDIAGVLACGATSMGAALGRSDVTARDAVVAACLGLAFGALWVRDRGAWLPWGAHTAFRFTTNTLVAGGVVQARVASDRWAGGDSGMLGGTAAVVALAPIAALAVVVTARRMSPGSARVG